MLSLLLLMYSIVNAGRASIIALGEVGPLCTCSETCMSMVSLLKAATCFCYGDPSCTNPVQNDLDKTATCLKWLLVPS